MKNHFTNREALAFANHLSEEERSPLTKEKYLRDVLYFLRFIKESYGSGTAVNKSILLCYKTHLGEKYAPASANSMIAALNSFFRWAGSPELTLKRFKIQRDSFCCEERELSKEEYFRLVRYAESQKNEQLSLMLQTICSTGIRVGELKFITAESVRLGEARVFAKNKSRRVFLIPKLRKKLDRFMKSRKIHTGAIFLSKSGEPISRNAVWKEMKSLCRGAGVSEKKVFPHNLRHLFARSFLEVERDVVKLADILGHASVNTTRIYTISSGSEHKRMMQMMRLLC